MKCDLGIMALTLGREYILYFSQVISGGGPELLSNVKAVEVFLIYGENIASESQVTLSAIPLP